MLFLLNQNEPKDKHCVLQCCSAPNEQYLNNICDNSSSISVPALPYITWGLIQDRKNKSGGIPSFQKAKILPDYHAGKEIGNRKEGIPTLFKNK